MGMFQAGNELGFHLEPANEVRVIGSFRQNDFDRDLALNGGLIGPVDDAKTTGADAFAEFVTSDNAMEIGIHGTALLDLLMR